MRKWLLIGLSVLSIVGISRFFSSDHSSLIRVNLNPSTVYWDGREVASTPETGANQGGTGDAPATLEYKGTLYVPLSVIGRQLNKPVGWDEASNSAWVGQPPAALAKQPSTNTATVQAPANTSAALGSSSQLVAKAEKPNTLFGISLGMSSAEVTKRLGAPSRKDPSSLGYQWWIYNRDPARYVQVGVANGKVVDLYSLAPSAKLGDIGIGTAMQALERQHPLQNVVTFTYMGANIQITNQKQQRPLVMENGTAAIYYLDQQNNDKVTALRLIDTQMLLRGGFYETKWSYRGQAPDFDPPALSVKERELVNAAYEQQILDLVNVSRYRFKLPALAWNDEAAQVARKHSLDMESNDFFDHVSASTGSDPFDRLKQAKISYRMAGENIAAGYPDAIEAHESWMNSPGHRKNVLEKGFTQLGVGVVTDYYTQTFLTPAE
ncbi:CAP-associated domain-containing protein [Brevibacillus choshinensis]|uniref:Secretion protein n=1 Tax=Brevibacillus choshinensis TaxID=54911 RepID=A0ABX7FR38_BRECH|nr:CAP-associated domain-containing protein [Brevibacillus choshinensis]QRG68180.1 secretion protein [Brevibacillus choshinensis]